MPSRGTTWEDEDILCLISIWKEYNIQEKMDGTTRNGTILRKVSNLLQQNGIERNAEQIRRKMKRLRDCFKKVEDNNNRSGRGRITCKFYKELSEIFAGRPETAPVALLASQPLNEPSLPEEESSDEDVGSEGGETERSDEANITPPDLVGSFVEDDIVSEEEIDTPEIQVTPPVNHGKDNKKRGEDFVMEDSPETVSDEESDTPDKQETSSKGGKRQNKKPDKRRKKTKLEQSLGWMSKEMKSLEEDAADRFHQREDEKMKKQIEWEKELLQSQQASEERRRDDEQARWQRELEFRESERQKEREHQLQMLQVAMAGFQNATAPWHNNQPPINHSTPPPNFGNMSPPMQPSWNQGRDYTSL